VVKDRSRPFSRKHRKTWLFVTGGMLLIGAINVIIGLLLWPGDPPPPEPIILDIPGINDAGLPPSASPPPAPPTASAPLR
jgi:hypothetical protein